MRIATLANAAVGHTRRWVEDLRSRGHEVGVWSLERGPAELGASPLPVSPLPGFLRYPLAAPALRAALARFAPDLVDAHFVDADDVRMLQTACRGSLTAKPAHKFRTGKGTEQQHFDRDQTIQTALACFIDDAHPAAGDFFEQFVITESPAGGAGKR